MRDIGLSSVEREHQDRPADDGTERNPAPEGRRTPL
jgi:hypothetical protein